MLASAKNGKPNTSSALQEILRRLPFTFQHLDGHRGVDALTDDALRLGLVDHGKRPAAYLAKEVQLVAWKLPSVTFRVLGESARVGVIIICLTGSDLYKVWLVTIWH